MEPSLPSLPLASRDDMETALLPVPPHDPDDVGHRLGNFWNYYSDAFNPPKNRLDLLPDNTFTFLCDDRNVPLTFVDIGCNSGDLSVGVAFKLALESKRRVRLLGVDIDSVLVNRARDKFSTLYDHGIDACWITADVMKENLLAIIRDWCQAPTVDLLSCFGTTMWIHVNHGDDALHKFLLDLSRVSSNLLIEPQTWSSYHNASKRLRRLGRPPLQGISRIKERNPDVFCLQVLREERCQQCETVILGKTAWGRRIFLFRRNCEACVEAWQPAL